MVATLANSHLAPSCTVFLYSALSALAWPERVSAEDEPCVAFRRTAGCSPAGARDPQMDVPCDSVVRSDWSGFCECSHGFTTAEVDCAHAEFTCAAACTKRWQAMQGQGGMGEGATSADAGADGGEGEQGEGEQRTVGDADSDLEKLYRRGKQFYVVGNIELALRHYREALRQVRCCNRPARQEGTALR